MTTTPETPSPNNLLILLAGGPGAAKSSVAKFLDMSPMEIGGNTPINDIASRNTISALVQRQIIPDERTEVTGGELLQECFDGSNVVTGRTLLRMHRDDPNSVTPPPPALEGLQTMQEYHYFAREHGEGNAIIDRLVMFKGLTFVDAIRNEQDMRRAIRLASLLPKELGGGATDAPKNFGALPLGLRASWATRRARVLEDRNDVKYQTKANSNDRIDEWQLAENEMHRDDPADLHTSNIRACLEIAEEVGEVVSTEGTKDEVFGRVRIAVCRLAIRHLAFGSPAYYEELAKQIS